MAFEQVRLFEITGFDSETGKPTISNTPIPFLAKGASEQEINNISVTIQPEYSEKSYSADNKVEKNTVIKGANASFTFYGIDADALDLLTSFKKDADGDVHTDGVQLNPVSGGIVYGYTTVNLSPSISTKDKTRIALNPSPLRVMQNLLLSMERRLLVELFMKAHLNTLKKESSHKRKICS